MKKAPIPINEKQRLKEIKNLNIMDTQPEERYDRITRMAKGIFGVQAAIISFIDDHRQWYKSKQGVDADEVPRDLSFCTHTINYANTLVIEDASKDERFCDNPFVKDSPFVRFYAGYPFELNKGIKLGTLCIFDDKPRNFSSTELALFDDFGKLVESELSGHMTSMTDKLTGISNRHGVEQLGMYLLDHAIREDMEISVFYLDLNSFKKINDTYGHSEGDSVLIKVAEVLKKSVRKTDIVARLGGDEFCILFPKLSDDNTDILINRINQNLDDVNKTLSNYQISLSIGYQTFEPNTESSINEFLSISDKKMYEMKNLHKANQKLV